MNCQIFLEPQKTRTTRKKTFCVFRAFRGFF